jgi:hypothetical protein
MTEDLGRREILKAATVATAALTAVTDAAIAQAQPGRTTIKYETKPLPFYPKKSKDRPRKSSEPLRE